MKLFNKTIDRQLFKQYPIGSDLSKQEVVVKIFNPQGRGNWFILNSDPEDPDYLWAIVDLGYGAEVGSVSRSDLETYRGKFGLGFERDLSFDPVNAEELYKGLRQGKYYAKGGGVDDYSDLYGQEVMALKNAKTQAKKTGYDYLVYLNKEGEISLARKNEFERFFDKDYCEILYSIDEKGNVTKVKSYADGGEVSFIDYNESEIMYEPHNKKYYANDVEFDSLQEAKDFIDSGETDAGIRDAYSKGLFADGGNLSRDQKFLNHSEPYEMQYAKGKNRKSYEKNSFADGGNLRQSLEEVLKQDVTFLKFDSGRANDKFSRLDIPFINVHDYDFNHYCIIETKNLEKVLDNVSKGVRVVKKKFSSDDLGFDYQGRTIFADGGLFQPLSIQKQEGRQKLKENIIKALFVDKKNPITEVALTYSNSEYSVPNINKQDIRNIVREINESKKYKNIIIYTNSYGVLSLKVENTFADGGNIENFSDNQQMIMNQNVELEHNHEELEDILEDEIPVPAWVVAKMATATQSISDVTHYLDGEKELMEDEDEDEEEDEDEIKNKEVVEPINVSAGTKAEMTKKFTDDALGNLKGFLKGMEGIDLRDDYAFDYKGEQFEVEPIINSDDNGVSNAVFTIFDGDGEEVGEVAYSREGGKQKFTANSDYFQWNNAKFEDGGFMNNVYADGGYFDGTIPKVSTYMTNYAEGGEIAKAEVFGLSKNVMGTTDIEMKITGMRKAQDFIVYPIGKDDAGNVITIQSDTRIGQINLVKGVGVMSQSHSSGAYFVHLQMDKLTSFTISESDLENIKAHIFKTAGANVGTRGIVSDNSGALGVYADGGSVKRTRRTKDQIRKAEYNKEVDLYNWYVVNLSELKAESGFEHKGDALDLLSDYDGDKNFKIVSKRALKALGIEIPNESWKYDNGGDVFERVKKSGWGNVTQEEDDALAWYRSLSMNQQKQVDKHLESYKSDLSNDKFNKRGQSSKDFSYAMRKDKIIHIWKREGSPEPQENKGYANGGSFNYDFDGIAYAKTNAKSKINWDKELREYVGSDYNSLTEREKEEMISDLKRDWDRSHSYAEGGQISKSEYENLLQQYDKLGALLEDCEDEKERGFLSKKMNDIESQIHKYERSYAKGGSLEVENVKIGDWLQNKENKAKAKVFNIEKDRFSTDIFVQDLYGNKVSRPIDLDNWKKITEPTRELARIEKMKQEFAEEMIYAKGGSLEDRLTKLEKKKSDLESKLFEAKLKANEVMSNIGFGAGMRRSKVNVSTTREDSLKERIEVVEKEIQEIKKESAWKNSKYIDHSEIKTVTVKRNGKEVTYKGEDVLNGANILAEGGDLSSKANYIPKRDIVGVELKDGTTIKPANGYWVKKGAEPITSKQEFTSKDLPKNGSDIYITAPAMSGAPAVDLVLKYDSKNFRFDVYQNGVKKDMIGEKEVLNNLNSGIYVLSNKSTPTSSSKSQSNISTTEIRKDPRGNWRAETTIDDFNGYDWRLTTLKTYSGQLISSAQGGKFQDSGTKGISMFKYTMYEDPYHTLEASKPTRLTEKVVSEQHEKALVKFKKFMETGMFKGGGQVSNFDKLSAKVAKEHEGKPVKSKYQEEYGHYYSKEEAQEVGDKVAGKVKAMQTDSKAFGGLFSTAKKLVAPEPNYPKLEGKQVALKSGELVQVFTQVGSMLSVLEVGKMGSGQRPYTIDISEVDSTSFKMGGSIGNKKTNSGAETLKKANDLAKEIRKEGESWLDAKRRAFTQLKK